MTKKRRHNQRVAMRGQGSGKGKKKQRVERGRYWIEDCPDTTSSITQQQQQPVEDGHSSSCFTVWITRAELWDDHHRRRDNKAEVAVTKSDPATDSLAKVPADSSSSLTVSDKLEQSVQEKKEDCDLAFSSSMPKNENLESSKVEVASNPLDDASVPPTNAECSSPSTLVGTTSVLAMETSTTTTATTEQVNESTSAPVPVLVSIQRAASALKPRSTPPRNPQFKLLPHGDCGDGVKNPHPTELVDDKYWAQRRRLFSKFDHGICMDSEGWYSVTPEVIAQHIARRMVDNSNNSQQAQQRRLTVIDAFGGVGGNTVAFCRNPQVERVVCVDTDENRLRMAANNCRVYGIAAPKVVFLLADACTVLESYKNGHLLQNLRSEKHEQPRASTDASTDSLEGNGNKPASSSSSSMTTTLIHGYTFGSSLDLLPLEIHAIFLSPPWGGPEVVEETGRRAYGLDCIQLETTSRSSSCGNGDAENDNEGNRTRVVDGEDVLRMAFQALPPSSKNVAYFLPRNTNGKKIAMSAIQAGFRGFMELEANILNCKLKTITAYFGSHKNPT